MFQLPGSRDGPKGEMEKSNVQREASPPLTNACFNVVIRMMMMKVGTDFNQPALTRRQAGFSEAGTRQHSGQSFLYFGILST